MRVVFEKDWKSTLVERTKVIKKGTRADLGEDIAKKLVDKGICKVDTRYTAAHKAAEKRVLIEKVNESKD